MAVDKQYCVYIMTNAHNTVLYTGMTNTLARRAYEHKNALGGIFTKKYNIQKLVYFEIGNDVNAVTPALQHALRAGSAAQVLQERSKSKVVLGKRRLS